MLKKSDYKTLIKALNQPANSAEIARNFRRLFNQMLSEFEEHPNPIAIINRLRQINRMLGRVELDHFTESQRSELFGQLAEVSYILRYLAHDEDSEMVKPVIVTGFTPVLNRIVKQAIDIFIKIKLQISSIFKSY